MPTEVSFAVCPSTILRTPPPSLGRIGKAGFLVGLGREKSGWGLVRSRGCPAGGPGSRTVGLVSSLPRRLQF